MNGTSCVDRLDVSERTSEERMDQSVSVESDFLVLTLDLLVRLGSQ